MTRQRKRLGRPRGPKTFSFTMRITFEQKRDLRVLGKVMDGRPSRNGLIQTAIDEYVATKVVDAVIGPKYNNELNRPRLKLVD